MFRESCQINKKTFEQLEIPNPGQCECQQMSVNLHMILILHFYSRQKLMESSDIELRA